jgi:protein SCO1/2
MKTKFGLSVVAAFAIGVVVGGRSLLAGDSAQASRASTLLPGSEPAACCAPVVEKPSCCAAEESVAPLSARSLYQHDAVWTSDGAEPFALATLRGRPVVLTMFFASCGYACPVLVSDMQRLRELLPAEVRAEAKFVLVSFDTERDTPEALREFRERSGLDEAWVLLRGDEDAVQELAMLLGIKFKRDANGQFSHSNLLTILDGEGEIAHRRNGLMGDVSEAARAVVVAATRP